MDADRRGAAAFAVGPFVLELPGGDARLEPLTLAHAAELYEAGREASIWTYLSAHPRSVADMERFVASAIELAVRGEQVPFAIVSRRLGRAVGSTRYMDIQPANRSLEIGWTWLGVEAQRTRINTECKYLLMRHAFETLGAVRVSLKTDARNERSQAAIRRIGAQYEGRLRRHMILPDGHVRDTVYFSVIAEEWPGVRERLERVCGAGKTGVVAERKRG